MGADPSLLFEAAPDRSDYVSFVVSAIYGVEIPKVVSTERDCPLCRGIFPVRGTASGHKWGLSSRRR